MAKHSRSWRRRLGEVSLVAGAVVVLDQLAKVLVVRAFRPGEGVPLLGDFLWLRHVQNPGVAFGLLSDLAWRYRICFFLLTAAVAVFILWKILADGGHLASVRLSVAAILGGAVGNLIDRLRTGLVTDYVEVWFGRYQFPNFNVADSCISVGTAFLLFALWRAKLL